MIQLQKSAALVGAAATMSGKLGEANCKIASGLGFGNRFSSNCEKLLQDSQIEVIEAIGRGTAGSILTDAVDATGHLGDVLRIEPRSGEGF
jgi:hypothetical protein